MKQSLFITLLAGLLLVFLKQTSGFAITPRLKCSGTPADIVFVLDSSSSIWEPHFKKQLDFVTYMVDRLDIGMGPEQVRVGVEVFSDTAHVKINLNESAEKELLKNKIAQINRLLGDTNTADALNKLRQVMFKPERGSRPGVKHVALILTDGASMDEAATQVAAKACRDANIQIFAIGIGRETSLLELIGIASEPKEKFLIRAPTYEHLDYIRDKVVRRTCYAVVTKQPTTTSTTSTHTPSTTATTTTMATTTTTPIPSTTVKPTSTSLPESSTVIPSTTTTSPFTTKSTTTKSTTSEPVTSSIKPTTDWLIPADKNQDERACRNKVADVFFLLDSSSSIRTDEFKKQTNAIEDIVNKFDIGPTKTRVGLSVFTHNYNPVLSFDSGDNKAAALKKIRHIMYMGGGTKTGKALHQIRSHVFNEALVRPGAERILIVFTDGMSSDYERTSAEANLLQESGVKIFVVGIGPDVDQIELQDIASKPSTEFVHTFATFDNLLLESRLLTYKTCTVNDQTFTKDQNACNVTRPTDILFMVSKNRFGHEKTQRILKASAEVIRKVGINGVFRFGTMLDDCPPSQEIAIGSITDQSQMMHEINNLKYSTLASLLGKLDSSLFPGAPWNSRKVGLIFLDKTIDINDPQIVSQARHALSQNIELYVVIIGDNVDMRRVQAVLVPKERIINVYSYKTLESYLPLMFAKRFCVPHQIPDDRKPTIA